MGLRYVSLHLGSPECRVPPVARERDWRAVRELRGPLETVLSDCSGVRCAARLVVHHYLSFVRDPLLHHIVLAVWRDGELLGTVHGKQWKFLWARSGYLWIDAGDLTLATDGLIAPPGHRKTVLRAAAAFLTSSPALHTVAIRLQPGSTFTFAPEDLGRLEQARCQVTTLPQPAILPLPASFADFLTLVGYNARRNIRNHRRRAAKAGVRFVAKMSPAEVSRACAALWRHQRTSEFSYQEILYRRTLLDHTAGVFWSGLRTDAGEWLCLIGGWLDGSHAYALLQLNHSHPKYAGLSLSTLVRSHLIEGFCEAGVADITFVGGCEGLFRDFCRIAPDTRIILEKDNFRARCMRLACAAVRRIKNLLGGRRFRILPGDGSPDGHVPGISWRRQ